MKTVLITGAYRGLGYEVGRHLSERGWQVILTARRKEQGSAAAAKLKNATFVEFDIIDDSSVTRATKQVPKLDVLINNIGRLERPALSGRRRPGNCLARGRRSARKDRSVLAGQESHSLVNGSPR